MHPKQEATMAAAHCSCAACDMREGGGSCGQCSVCITEHDTMRALHCLEAWSRWWSCHFQSSSDVHCKF